MLWSKLFSLIYCLLPLCSDKYRLWLLLVFSKPLRQSRLLKLRPTLTWDLPPDKNVWSFMFCPYWPSRNNRSFLCFTMNAHLFCTYFGSVFFNCSFLIYTNVRLFDFNQYPQNILPLNTEVSSSNGRVYPSGGILLVRTALHDFIKFK